MGTGPLTADELRLIDAYWRAANYLSVGQIYLLDNPLLREPLKAEHVKPRLLGHFGTTPGLNLIWAHLNRAIRARELRDLRHRPGPRRAGDRRERVSRGHVLRALPERRPGRGGAARALPPVLVPGRDSEPRRARDARLDPRGRRARVRARARLRRRLRQPRAARLLRRRRRRGRDRAARGELALEQVPQPRTDGAVLPDPAPERLQDREPDGARADPGAGARRADGGLRAPAAARHAATTPRRSTRTSRPRSTTRSTRSAGSSRRRAPARRPRGRAGR